ncbi:hypothetical protein Q5P01_023292 [Channa striata]|uniref:Uncharacterized protein n=1 Tax=Channa striata TaxID=64152 RepID=A0AA88J633_CHASR|nr:hypothetical protein Q5P01_023292 [Channa striata]
MTRQRTQAEALRNTAAPDAAQRTMGISSSYNLCAMTTGSKPPNSGLPRPPLSNMSSGIQKAAPGLRPPTARNNAPASSSTDKLHGSTAANPVMKNVPAKKHPLTRADTLPTAKRSKMEAPLASGCTEASTSSCAAANRAKSLKHPTTTQRSLQAKSKRDGCAKCVELEHIKEEMKMMSEEMKIKSEEIRQLREELLKYRKQKGEC